MIGSELALSRWQREPLCRGRRRAQNAAFTLVEVLIALTVLTTALVLCFRGFSMGLRMASLAKQYTLATFLLKEKIAEVETQPILETGNDSGDFEELDHPEFRWEVTVDESDLDLPNLYEVTIRVFWTDRDQERDVSVTKLIALRQSEIEEEE